MPNLINPEYLEGLRKEMLADGIQQADADLHIADFLEREYGEDSEYSRDYNIIRNDTLDENGSENPDAVSAFLDFYAYGTTQPEQRFGAEELEEPEEGGLLTPAIEGISGIIEERAGQAFESIGAQVKGEQTLPETAFQIGTQAVGVPLDILDSAIGFALKGAGKVIPESLKERAKTEFAQAYEKDPLAQSVVGGIQDMVTKLEDAKAKSPRLGRNVDALLDTGNAILTALAVKPAKKLAEEAVATTQKIPSIAGKLPTTSKEGVDEIVGQIIQGTARDIPKAKKALSLVDTSGVKTFKDLGQKFSEKIATLGSKQDELLAGMPDLHKLDDFAKTSKLERGGKTFFSKKNFVEDSINQLEELYDKVGDIDSLVRIRAIKDKAVNEGLSALDVNKIAREYGSEFGEKAFSKRTGEALTSVNAESFETVRSGVKDAARNLLPDDASKLIDAEMSAIFNTQRLVRKMEDAAQKLSQKVKKRGLIEKLFRGAGKTVDVATLGGPRAFLTSFLPSNIGNKVLNSLDLQDALVKNLKKLDKLLKDSASLSDEELIKQINNFSQ